MSGWSARRRWWLLGASLLVPVSAAVVAIYAGVYNVAADVPHTQPVYWLLETVRERSVVARARDIKFQTIWRMRIASQEALANTLRCAAVVILRPA